MAKGMDGHITHVRASDRDITDVFGIVVERTVLHSSPHDASKYSGLLLI